MTKAGRRSYFVRLGCILPLFRIADILVLVCIQLHTLIEKAVKMGNEILVLQLVAQYSADATSLKCCSNEALSQLTFCPCSQLQFVMAFAQ